MSKHFNSRNVPREAGARPPWARMLAGLGQMGFYLFVLACSLVALVALVFASGIKADGGNTGDNY